MKPIRSATTLLVSLLMLTSTSAQDTPTEADVSTCYGCLNGGGGALAAENYMCSPPDSMTLKTEGGLICCQPGVNAGKSFCARGESAPCTPTFAKAPYKWWLACPQATKENCGGQKVITAYAEPQTWGQSNMRLVINDPDYAEKFKWKQLPGDNHYDLCWWVFKAEKGKWQSGKIVYKFSKKDIGINVFTFASEESSTDFFFPDLVKRINDNNNQPVVDQEYEIDVRYDFLIQAIPLQDSKDTDFEFEFKVVGKEWPYYLQGHEWLKNQEDAEAIYIWASVISCVVLVLFIGAPIGCCIMCLCCKHKMCCKSGNKTSPLLYPNQVSDTHTQPTEHNQNRAVAPYDHQTSGQEMELESLDGVQNRSQEKTYQPSNSDAQQAAYANPFKKNRQQKTYKQY